MRTNTSIYVYVGVRACECMFLILNHFLLYGSDDKFSDEWRPTDAIVELHSFDAIILIPCMPCVYVEVLIH